MNALAASFPVSNDPENIQVITTVATSLKVPVILNQDSRVQDKGNFISTLKEIYTTHSLDYFRRGRHHLCGKGPECRDGDLASQSCCPQWSWVLSKQMGSNRNVRLYRFRMPESDLLRLCHNLIYFPSHWNFNQSEHQLMTLSYPFD